MSQKKKIETFHISTYGCQMNLADSSTLSSSLETRGYRPVVDEKDADLIVLNTCSVREKAENRIYGRLGEIYKYKRKKPYMKIAVVGCMAQRLGDELIKKVPHVDFVLGTDRLFELPDALEGIEGTSSVMTAFGHENMDMIAPVKDSAYSGFVTISRGCDNYCTYCIVPFVRGKERSHSDDYIVDAVKKMVDEGIVEATLLGQNVNSYKYNDTDFPTLLKRVVNETGIKRLRYMTSHPKDLSKQLVDAMAEDSRIMPHIHLPIQSGSNRVLQKMGRIYTIEHYMKIIEYIKKSLPYVSLTTDIIVGYPSETETEFEETLKAVSEVCFDSAFMFRYSVRPTTVAASYIDDVPDEDKIRRLQKLIKLQQDISYEVNQKEVNQIHFSIVEGYSKKSPEKMRARTDGNKIVIFDAKNIKEGTILPIKITAADAFTLHGEVAEPN